MTVKSMAREEVVTVTPGASARDVALKMEESDIGSVVVVEDGMPVGILTDRDLAVHVVGENADAAELTAAELMTEELFTVHDEEGIYDVLAEMCEVGVRRVPLVDDEGAVSGIVTLDDFIVLLTSELENVSGVVQGESPPY
jgi:CBS domain-containing protein